ncbi:MAG: efflux RND transporter periplasmic adaptor subunit [Patescibacteria group bacterium]|nr:efflux RND transporter periplasmic adaptor subunit [Patescibacteria group bacterium]MDD4611231.1 efflux RND transporter periplasmic adaptor subunit [Patescibacteria group bacterium]
MISKTLAFIKRRKLLAIIAIIILAGAGYFIYGKIFQTAAATRYLTAKAEKGTLIVSVSASGQVSASNQVEIKPKASGEITAVKVASGQEIKNGDIIALIDSREAQKTVRDAQANLQSAQIAYDKLVKPADALALLQAENSLSSAKDTLTKLKLSQQIEYDKAKEAKQQAQDSLNKSYDDAYNNIANAFLELPGIMTGLDNVYYNYDFTSTQINLDWYYNQLSNDDIYQRKADTYRESTTNAYETARKKYEATLSRYKTSNRNSSPAEIESLLNETYETTKNIAEAVKAGKNYIDYIQDFMELRDQTIPTTMRTHQTNLDSYTGTTNSHLITLYSIKQTIDNAKTSILNADRDLEQMEQNNPLEIASAEQAIKDKELTLADLKNGADQLDIQSQKLSLQQKQNALYDAREILSDYTIRAPFDGVVAQLDAKKGDQASSGTSLATIITKQKIAEISFNEVDVAKLKVGQKATLAFDAVPDLSITGQVVEINTIGTASQGVVTYTIKIAFDTDDERIKPSMTVSAAVIIDSKSDVLLVPNSAIKTQGQNKYIEIIEGDNLSLVNNASSTAGAIQLASAPRHQQVEVGLSNDEKTEITSGLEEGDVVVSQTITGTTTTTSSSQNKQSGGMGIPGLGEMH